MYQAIPGMSTPETFYRGWETYQGQLIRALSPLSSEQLAMSAGQNLRTVSSIVRHMIGARARWIRDLVEEGGDLDDYAAWDRPGSPERTADELVTGLQATWKSIRSALDSWTPELMGEAIIEEEDGETYTFTRSWIIWHLIEHDLHHGGEFSYSLGMHGVTGIDL